MCTSCSGGDKPRFTTPLVIINPAGCSPLGGRHCICRCHFIWAGLQMEKQMVPPRRERLNVDHPTFSRTRVWPAA